ncbi:hypothetical protein [Sphingomonas sp.]|uniref:hypothetical protein n=1 Tax=Sphingomonas sp. TaxID=28214 RepID=UPI003AFF87DD
MNLPVASRVIGFTQPPPNGVVSVGVIFDPSNAASQAEAAAIEQQASGGLATGRGTIRVRRIPVSALGGLAGIRVAFVTVGVREQQQVADLAARNSILTITSDLACVQAARCVVGITGGSQPQITVSRAAAKAAKVRFGSAFLMLVKEI